MFLGLINPNKGNIIINKQQKISSLENFRGIISYMPQDPIILDNTIEKNITFENEEKKIDRVKYANALNQSNLNKVLNQLPEKDKTFIGENGVRLSGGQYKRIALARTFYFGKKIIVMDEATNSLDLDSEKYIMEQVNELKNKKTIIIITHRLDILKNCNKIYKIENKKINLMEEK
jgi:ABC-type bacteriocin/lantibiotic exporter with double-glycine peptidase domain